MKAEGSFSVDEFQPENLASKLSVETALPVSIATLVKRYTGNISGTSVTIFTAAFDRSAGKGTYVAMESFEGYIHDLSDSFNFMHSASTTSGSRENEIFRIVDQSGTRELEGISGTGGIEVDANGMHRIWIEYSLPNISVDE
jgi:hypothetical protein